MTSVHARQKNSLLFRFFTIPFLLDGLVAYADPPIGSVPSQKSLSVPAVVAKVRPSVVTILMRLTRGVPTVDQLQIYYLGDLWHALRPCGDQPTFQLTIQRKNAQSTISLQNPSLPKAVP